MFKPLCITLALCLGIVFPAKADNRIKEGNAVILNGTAAQLVVNLSGGGLVDFHMQDHGLNPLQWDSWFFSDTPEADPPFNPRPMGHFLCLDRWGAVTEAEQAAGMTPHGEAARVDWKLLSNDQKKNGTIRAQMEAVLPKAGLSIKRTIELHDNRALFTVREDITCRNKLGRIYNAVQHPTIVAPFLNESTKVDSNAGKGFMQHVTTPIQEEPSVQWPQALASNGEAVDMRSLSDKADPKLASYTIEDDYGWITATSADQGLLIGYIWPASAYEWINTWQYVHEGKPLARGLEFGTTGLHQPLPVLIEKGQIFDRKLFKYIEPGETQSFSYASFLFKVSADFKGVARIVYKDGRLTLHEHGASPERSLTMQVGKLFPR